MKKLLFTIVFGVVFFNTNAQSYSLLEKRIEDLEKRVKLLEKNNYVKSNNELKGKIYEVKYQIS